MPSRAISMGEARMASQIIARRKGMSAAVASRTVIGFVSIVLSSILLATQAFVEHLDREAGHVLYAIRPIGIGAHLMFNCEHGNPVQKSPQNPSQCAGVYVNNTPLFLAPLYHFYIEHEDSF